MNLILLASDLSAAPATVQMPVAASVEAANVDWLYYFIYWLCVFFFVVICIAMAAFARIYRRQPGVQADNAHTHHLGLELGWTIPPTIIVVFLFWWGFEGFMELRSPPADAYKIEATAEKWKWTWTYPNGAQKTTASSQIEESLTTGTPLDINEGLHVWAGQPFVVVMTSTDVLHSFYVPAFRVKQDIVPGRYTHVWFTPLISDDAGDTEVHRLFCTEYCGTDHSQMWSQVVVHRTKESFDAWLKDAKKSAWDTVWNSMPEMADSELGRQDPEYLVKVGEYFYKQECASCHNINGAVKVGPNYAALAKLYGQERKFADGSSASLADDEAFLAYVKQSIDQPNSQIVEGYQPGMTLGLGDKLEAEAPEPGLGYKAMAAFIKSLASE